jgi:transposase
MKKVVHVALDSHQRSIAIAHAVGEREPVVREIPNSPKIIRRTMEELRKQGDLRVCYEAGPCGFEIYRQLVAMGIACQVIAPALIPQRPGDRIKTDRRDALKLLRLYRAGELTAIHVPTSEQEGVRDLVRAREDIRKDLVAAKHRLAKFLLRHGRIFSEGENWTERHWKWLRAQSFEGAAEQTTFEHYVVQVDHLLERRTALEGQPANVVALVKKAQQRLHKRLSRLTARGKKHQVAITAVARELCGFVWAMERAA